MKDQHCCAATAGHFHGSNRQSCSQAGRQAGTHAHVGDVLLKVVQPHTMQSKCGQAAKSVEDHSPGSPTQRQRQMGNSPGSSPGAARDSVCCLVLRMLVLHFDTFK